MEAWKGVRRQCQCHASVVVRCTSHCALHYTTLAIKCICQCMSGMAGARSSCISRTSAPVSSVHTSSYTVYRGQEREMGGGEVGDWNKAGVGVTRRRHSPHRA